MDRDDLELLLGIGLLTVAATAAILQVHKLTVYRMIDDGRLEAINIAKGTKKPIYRIKTESVKSLLGE